MSLISVCLTHDKHGNGKPTGKNPVFIAFVSNGSWDFEFYVFASVSTWVLYYFCPESSL